MVRRPGAAVLVGLLTSLLLLGTPPAAAELSAVGSESVSAVAACTAQADHLLAAVVVDESSSLRDTDPGDLRVGAIETALDSLERLADDGDALTVEARLSVFGETSTELVGWGDLAGGHAEELRTAVREELPERDGARLTDYRRALGDAQAALGDRAAELGGTACKLVLWLTDGKLDVDGWGEGPATAAARAELCEPGGLVDGVRADGITVVAMGLMTSAGRGAVTDLDRDRLRAIAEGSAGSESCGTAPVPADVTNGAFLNADDAGALARLFAEMGALLEGLTPSGTVGCPGAECPDGRFPIAADPGVGGFRLVAESTPDAAAMHLVAPDGTTVVLDRPTTDVGGSSVSVLVTGSLTTVDVRGLERNTGTWTLVTDPTATTLIDVYHFWGVTLTVEAPHGVVIGEPSELRITPRTTDGSPVHLDTYSSTTLEATVGGEVHELRPDGDGWATDVTVPADAAPSSLVVTGRATAVTHPNGIELGPVMVEQSLTTQFPASFPVPTPARVDLGRLSGERSAAAALTFTGSEHGPTRVCLGPGTVTAHPARAGDVTLTADTECSDIAAGASVDVTVTFTAEAPADGRVEGSIPVTLVDIDGATIDAHVPVTGTMVRPVDGATRWGLVAALTALALGLAYLSAVGARRLLGRFRLSPYTKYAEVPVRISDRGLERTDGATALLSSEEFRHLPVQGRHRSFRAGSVTHEVRYPWNPLAEPQAVVRTAGRVPVTHVARQPADPWLRRTELPGSTGFVVAAQQPLDGEDAVRGTLTMVVDPGRETVAALLPHRLAELGRVHWPRELTRVRAVWADAAREAAAPAPGRPPAAGPPDTPPGRVPSGAGPPGGRSSAPPPPPGRRRPSIDIGRDAPPPPPGRATSRSAPRGGRASVPPPPPAPRGRPSADVTRDAPPPPPARATPPPPPPRR